MHVNAKADYALRAAVELAGSSRESPRKLHEIATAQGIPAPFLTDILTQLRSAGVVRSQRGASGGYWLARPADELRLGDVIRAIEGSLVEVRGHAEADVEAVGAALALQQVWIAVRNMLEQITIADLAAGELPQDTSASTGASQPVRAGPPTRAAGVDARQLATAATEATRAHRPGPEADDERVEPARRQEQAKEDARAAGVSLVPPS